MFIVLYDKNFRALGRWTTYPCSRWSLTRKAVEFDELTCSTRAMENSKNAVYVGLHNDDGSLNYLALCGKPTTAGGETKIKAVDLRQIFSQKLKIELSRFKQSYNQTVSELFRYLMSLPGTIDEIGIQYQIDTTDIDEAALTWKENSIVTEDGIANVWTILQGCCSWYNCYVETKVDLTIPSITFKVRVIIDLVSFKLSDFNQVNIVNDTTVTNRVITQRTDGTSKAVWTLLSDDTVVNLDTAKASYPSLIIYPARTETIEDDNDAEAIKKGLEILYRNRFQSKVTVDCNCAMGKVLLNLDLNAFADIYGYNAADNSTFKRLPVMAIAKSDNGSTKVSFGRLSEFWY